MSRDIDPRFGKRMLELLKERGLSYRDLAKETYYAKSHLHGLAHGLRAPSPECAARLDDALDAGGELVLLACPTPGGQPSAIVPFDVGAAASDTGDVLRRTMLAALAGLGVGQAADRLGLSTLLTALSDRQPDARGVDDWHEAVWEYGHTYLTASRPELLADLAADLATLTAVMDRSADPTALAGLNEAAGQLAGLVAMVSTDLGYTREARHAWRLARGFADEGGSASARMWVRGQEAVLGLYSRRPLPLVLDLADRGLAMAGATRAAGVATLGSARAQALAQLGRERDALEALHAVEDLYGHLPASVTADSDSIFGWPEHRLRHVESYVYSAAGRTPDAYRAQAYALAHYPTSKAIGRGQLQLHQAACMVRDGDIGDGLDHAVTTLTELPAYARGRFVLTIADTVLEAVPERERARPAVVEYRELLGSVRRSGHAA